MCLSIDISPLSFFAKKVEFCALLMLSISLKVKDSDNRPRIEKVAHKRTDRTIRTGETVDLSFYLSTSYKNLKNTVCKSMCFTIQLSNLLWGMWDLAVAL